MPVTLLSCSNYADDLTQSYNFLMVEATLKALLKHGFTIHAPRRQGTSEVISDVNVTAAVAAAAAPRISNKKLEECIAAVKTKSRSAEHSARRGSVCLPKNGWQLTKFAHTSGFFHILSERRQVMLVISKTSCKIYSELRCGWTRTT
jgi:hypothetical protein